MLSQGIDGVGRWFDFRFHVYGFLVPRPYPAPNFRDGEKASFSTQELKTKGGLFEGLFGYYLVYYFLPYLRG